MITKSIKTTGGPLKITIPSDRSEISLGMLIDLTPEPGHSYSQLEQLSILSGVPLENSDVDNEGITLYDICNLDDLSVFDEALQKLAYQLKAFVEVQEIPKQITIRMNCDNRSRWFGKRLPYFDKIVPVISNLGIAPAGAYMEAKEVIRADIQQWQEQNPEAENMDNYSPKLESYLHILALYFYCPATGEKFNSMRAAEFQEVIKKCMITDVLPIARHFFLNYPNLSKQKVKPSMAALKTLRSGRV